MLFVAQQALAFRPTALVMGSTDGIGVTTAKHLAAKGYNVLVHGRDPNRIEKACSVIRSFSQQNNQNVIIEPVKADLSSIHECEELANNVKSICEEKGLTLTVLMNNAGVYAEDFVTTPNGLELTFAVNVVAPFVLTSHLLPIIHETGRIVIASSISQCRSIKDWDDLPYYNKRTYSAHGAYSDSKLLDAMLAKEFAERLQQQEGFEKMTCNSLDPGTVNTKMLLAGWGPCGIDVEDALDQTYLCTSSDLEGVTGQYFTWRSQSRGDYPARERAKMWNILSELAPRAAAMWKFEWK